MRHLLIKTYLVLTIVYVAGILSAMYSHYSDITYHMNLIVIVLIGFIPGLFSGLIMNYETIEKYFRSKTQRIDFRFILFSIFLIVVASYPTWIYFISMKPNGYLNYGITISMQFQFALGLLAGYSITQSLTTQD